MTIPKAVFGNSGAALARMYEPATGRNFEYSHDYRGDSLSLWEIPLTHN
jgi:hypothetical protein